MFYLSSYRCALPFARLQVTSVISLVVLTPLLFYSHALRANQCAYTPVTSVSCDGAHDPGLVSVPINQRQHVGNPIDVITGAKQQRELDFQSMGSALHFSRYYHTAHTGNNLGLGYGWRHSYSVTLNQVNDTKLRIQQADGRSIDFTAIESDSAVFMASDLMDGYIVNDDKAVWYLPDDRTLRFHGSFLTHIDYPNGETLTLQYQHKRLHTVTDGQGLSLWFEYASANPALRDYETPYVPTHQGFLSKVNLPSGESIQFGYDKEKNLDFVVYPNEEFKRYGYQLADYPNHLTSIVEHKWGDIKTRYWQYDDTGRVARFDGWTPEHSLTLTYENPVHEYGSGTTLVKYKAGREERYQWLGAQLDDSAALSQFSVQDCETCERQIKPAEKPVAQTATDVFNDIARRRMLESAGTHVQADIEPWAPLPERDDISPIPNSLDRRVVFDLDGETHEFRIQLDRVGEVVNIRVGNTSLIELKDKWAERKMERCEAAPLLERTRINPAPDMACLEDLVYLVELARHLEQLDSRDDRKNAPLEQRSASAPHYCLVNPFQSCAELERAFEMAQLSNCVYEDVLASTCGSQWTLVDPTSIGLTHEQFNNGSFAAALYFNSQTGEYVLAFRGTDNNLDWWDNLLQGAGLSTNQYTQAVDLAADIKLALPNATLSTTGHSLGGGLATAAALGSSVQASVFNPAALHPNAAVALGLTYADADTLVNVTTVDGDPLTEFQTPPPNQTSSRHPAPGVHTVLAAPNDRWIQQQQSDILIFFSTPVSLILHSIDAVMQSAEEILVSVCGITPDRA